MATRTKHNSKHKPIKKAAKKSVAKLAPKKSSRKASAKSGLAKSQQLKAKNSSPPTNGQRPTTSDTALYLYGVSAALKTNGKPQMRQPGIDGADSIEAIACNGLTCWITRVPAAEFTSDLQRNMENLEWLADVSVRHQSAVSAIGARVTLVPARFGAVFFGQDSLDRHIKEQKSRITSALKKVESADEWGIKVFVRKPQAVSALATAASGADYLRKKAARLAEQNAARIAQDEDVKAFAAELGKAARATAPTGKMSAAQAGLQWQAAFLVSRSEKEKDRFDTVLRKYATKWGDTREIECSGPWPPYSFVE